MKGGAMSAELLRDLPLGILPRQTLTSSYGAASQEFQVRTAVSE